MNKNHSCFFKCCLVCTLLIGNTSHAQVTVFNLPKVSLDSFKITPSGLKYYFFTHNMGEQPDNGDKVYVDFTGHFLNDSVFYTTEDKGPSILAIGSGQLIAGWEEALKMMHPGDRGRFIIPWTLGYGKKAFKNIPAKSTLIFDIELLRMLHEDAVVPLEITGKSIMTTGSGLRYVFIEEGNGEKPVKGSIVYIHYNGFFENGKVFDSSIKRGDPLRFSAGDGSVIIAWDEAVQLMTQGSKMKIYVPWRLGYGKKGFAPLIPPKTDLIFDLELVEVKPEIIVVPYNVEGKDTIKTAEGLMIIKVEQGSGRKIKNQDVVTVNFTGYFNDGKIFDSSVKNEKPIQFPVGENFVIKGWDLALPLLNIGDKVRLIVPWELGYGKPGNKPTIPPKTDLIFDLEVLDAF